MRTGLDGRTSRRRILARAGLLVAAPPLIAAGCGPLASAPPAPATTSTTETPTEPAAQASALPPTATAAPAPTATATVPPTAAPAPALSPTATVAATATPAASPTPPPASPTPTAPPPAATPSPAPPSATAATPAAADALLILDTPVWGQAASGSVHVAGRARVFEAALAAALVVDGTAQPALHTTASAGAPAWGAFALDLPLAPALAGRQVAVRVFFASPRDGSVQRLAELPIRVGPTTPTVIPQVRVYFLQRPGPGLAYLPVAREAGETPALGHVALEALLAGPDAAEQAGGLRSPIPAGTTLRSLRIAGGVAAADFDRHLTDGVPAPAAALALGAIELTLRQFPSVQTVTITADGRAVPTPAAGAP